MMITSRICALLLLLSAVAGCRSDPSVAMLEAELRWVEDQYYQLESAYDAKCQQLESCRLANQAIRQTPDDADGGASSSQEERNSSRRRQEDEKLPFQPPTVEGLPDGETRPPGDALGRLPLHSPQAAGHLYDTQVTHIVLARQLTGGYDFDGKTGDEGVLVVTEPRNRAGQFVPLAGALDIEVRDPKKFGDAATLARWHLTPGQAQAKMKRSLLGRGMHVELPWPDAPPENQDLRLAVTYTTPGGKKLKAEQPIRIHPPRLASARWTPAPQATAQAARLRPNSDAIGGVAPAMATAPVNRGLSTTTENSPRSHAGESVPPWQPFR